MKWNRTGKSGRRAVLAILCGLLLSGSCFPAAGGDVKESSIEAASPGKTGLSGDEAEVTGEGHPGDGAEVTGEGHSGDEAEVTGEGHSGDEAEAAAEERSGGEKEVTRGGFPGDEEEVTGDESPVEEYIEAAVEAAGEAEETLPAHFTDNALEKDTYDGRFVNPLVLELPEEEIRECETDGDWDAITGEWLYGYTVLFGAAVRYTSSNPEVAVVDGCGIVEMLAPGETVISASVDGSAAYTAAAFSYTLTVTGEARTNLADCDISLFKTSYFYGETGEQTDPVSGEAVFDAYDWPAVRAFDEENPLTEGEDYCLEPSENAVNAGEASLTVAGTGRYYGTVRLSWTITKAAPLLTFSKETVIKSRGDGAFTNPLRQRTDGTIRFTSGNTSVAAVTNKGKVTIKGKGTAVITAYAAEGTNYLSGKASYTLYVDMVSPSVIYSAKVVGEKNWQAEVSDGREAGTTGKSLIMEALKIRLQDQNTGSAPDPSLLGLQYTGHIQNIGWDSWTKAGNAAGRPGGGLRMEALKIRLTGKLSGEFHIYYALHCQNYGWLDWAKDGEEAGTAGMALRVEAIRIMILPAAAEPPAQPGSFSQAYMYSPTIYYRAYVEGEGWQGEKTKGRLAGTSGQSLRLEGMCLRIAGEADLGIEYTSHVQNLGWEASWAADGSTSGKPGSGRRMEAVKLRLTGKDAGRYDLYYCLHMQNFGWLAWAKNGAPAGSSGVSMRVEAFVVKILPKGSPKPSNYGTRTAAFVDGIGASKLTLNKKTVRIARNKTVTLSAEVLPANRTFKGVTWSSSNPSAATVSSSGVITGRKKGTASITCRSNDGRASAVCEVTVT